MARLIAVLICCVVVAWSPPASSVTTLDVRGGQLFGASNVPVGSRLFDVEFVDGTCIAIFSGCDNAIEDFTFPTEPEARAASMALLDLVFFDGPDGNFDTDPGLTAGCASASRVCHAHTLHTIELNGFWAASAAANRIDELNDGRAFSGARVDEDETAFLQDVFARWSPAAAASDVPPPTNVIPLPATFILYGTVLAGLALVGWWRRRRTV